MVRHRLIKLLQTSNTGKDTTEGNEEVENEAVKLESEDVAGSFRSGENRKLSNDHETDGTFLKHVHTRSEKLGFNVLQNP